MFVYLCFRCVFDVVSMFSVVSISATDCLKKLVSKMIPVEWDVKPYYKLTD